MRYRIFEAAAIVAALVLVAACSSGSSSSNGGSTTPTITTMSELPRATSPMAASVASVSAQIVKDLEKGATTGLLLSTTSSADFTPASSMGACEMFNMVKGGTSSAAQADMILCFVQYMNSSDAFSALTDGSGNPVDIYDGEYHVFNLNIQQCTTDADCAAQEEGATCNADNQCVVDGVPMGGAPDRIKLKIAKDSAGSITNFEMFMCQYVGGTLTQIEYTSQTISGASVSMRAIGQMVDANGSGWHSVDVTGTLNSDGAYTEKVITQRNKGTWGGEGNLGWEEGTLTQGPASFYFSGYRSGSFAQGDDSGIYSQAAYGLGEMLGDISADISQLAMGDGAVKFEETGTYSNAYGTGEYTNNGVDAWLGDGAVPVDPASGSSYYNAANDGDLPTVQAEISFAFAASEIWDCSGDDVVSLPQIAATTMQAACSEYSFGHDWVECWQVIDQAQEQPPEE